MYGISPLRKMRTSLKMRRFAADALEAASLGFEILLATRRYQRVLGNEGLEGIRRIVDENRQRELHAWIRAARRAKLIKARRIGRRLRVALTDTGRLRLLKLRIGMARRLPRVEMVLVAFDFPISQRKAREAFRYFLKTCGFEKLQQSLWRSRHDVAAPLQEFIRRSGTNAWARIFRANERLGP